MSAGFIQTLHDDNIILVVDVGAEATLLPSYFVCIIVVVLVTLGSDFLPCHPAVVGDIGHLFSHGTRNHHLAFCSTGEFPGFNIVDPDVTLR